MTSAAGTGNPAERRKHPRKNVIDSQLLTVALPGEEAAHRRGIVLDVSEGGMAVQPFVPLTPGSTSGIECDLAGTTLFKGTGLVAWVGPGGRAGIRFIDVPPEAREQLRQFLGVERQDEHTPDASLATTTTTTSPESEELDLDGALEMIAERARDITAASGVAVALGDSLGMTCRVSKGMAPDVGAQLQRDAGLSGYCLRTGELVHCADTLEDARIDPAVAQQLNVRSILIVPVFAGAEIVGVLEVLSAHPHAFEPRHVVRLQRIAQLLSGALETNLNPELASGAGQTGAPAEPAVAKESDPPAGAALQAEPALPSVVTDEPVNAADVAAPALSTATEELRPVPEPEPVTPAPAMPLDRVTNEPEAACDPMPLSVAAPEQQEAGHQEPGPAIETAPPAEPQGQPELPQKEPEAQPQPLRLQPVKARRLPTHSRARSTGARQGKGGRPIQNIGPVYLTSATGLGGEVVLGATITTEGMLDNVHVVSGPKLLGSAAAQTVLQWRCQPYELNGAPIEVDTRITIHFAPAK